MKCIGFGNFEGICNNKTGKLSKYWCDRCEKLRRIYIGKQMTKLLKEFELTVTGLVGFEKAIITSGGVDIKEIDPKTCKSKIIDNLYLAGEVLDIDGPTGGYNLQIAWSTGYLVGENIK